jgi:hypothetical protein
MHVGMALYPVQIPSPLLITLCGRCFGLPARVSPAAIGRTLCLAYSRLSHEHGEHTYYSRLHKSVVLYLYQYSNKEGIYDFVHKRNHCQSTHGHVDMAVCLAQLPPVMTLVWIALMYRLECHQQRPDACYAQPTPDSVAHMHVDGPIAGTDTTVDDTCGRCFGLPARA